MAGWRQQPAAKAIDYLRWCRTGAEKLRLLVPEDAAEPDDGDELALGRPDEARDATARALALATNSAERDLLASRLASPAS